MINNKLEVVIICLLLCVASVTVAQKLSNKIDSISYAVGVSMANEYKAKGMKNLNINFVQKGMKDYYGGKELLMDKDASTAMMNNYIKELKQQQMMQNKAAGEAFLAENAKKEGVITLPSGLQYEVINSGEGASPSATDKVLAHYHGMLIDGTVFDSSVERNEPITLPVNGVILGWQEALQLMKEGDKWRLYIPSELGYGGRGAGPVIKPYSALIFDVELLEVK